MSSNKTTPKSRAPKRSKNKNNRKPEVPAWFERPADAMQYHILAEHVQIRMDGKHETILEPIIENIDPGEFVAMAQNLGKERGYANR